MNGQDKRNKILVVDDHPAVRQTMHEILNAEGFATKVASNGAEALELCSQENFDFVLIDVQMPDLNGVEVLKQSKELSAHRPKFIFFTAYAIPELEDLAKSLGAFAFLRKPIKVETILSLIRQNRNFSILIHFQNEELRNRMVSLLENRGYLLTQATNHDDALIQLRQINYNVVVYDSDSPSLEQESILRTIKSLNSDTKCIETNEDEDFEEIVKAISFFSQETRQTLN